VTNDLGERNYGRWLQKMVESLEKDKELREKDKELRRRCKTVKKMTIG